MSEVFLSEITALTSEGEGIASINGYKVFVTGALPGEKVLFTISERRKNFGRGHLITIETRSPDRINPPCPLFGQCGGCQIMHLDYSKQLEIKTKRVEDALLRIAHCKNIVVSDCIASPTPLNYRNKIQLPISKGKIGLFQKGSHEIIPLERCYIHNKKGEEIYHQIRDQLHTKSLRYVIIKNTSCESLIIFVTDGSLPHEIKNISHKIWEKREDLCGIIEMVNKNDNNVILSPNIRTIEGRSFIYEHIQEKTFRISASSFFQVNTLQAQSLISFVIQEASIQKGDIFLDAYCGVGTFSLFAADYAAHAIGIEVNESAIKDAQENALINGQTNLTFHTGLAQDLIPNLPDFDIILLNPPRKGCDSSLIQEILRRKPQKILYVSCDPATLARDLALLCHNDHYKIHCVQPFDMFPQTMHVETVVSLIRNF